MLILSLPRIRKITTNSSVGRKRPKNGKTVKADPCLSVAVPGSHHPDVESLPSPLAEFFSFFVSC